MSRRRRRNEISANPERHDSGSPRDEAVSTRRVYSVEIGRDGWVLTVADVPRDLIEAHKVIETPADLRELTLARMLRHIDRRDMGME